MPPLFVPSLLTCSMKLYSMIFKTFHVFYIESEDYIIM